jgi:hypothetical protein
MTPKRTTSQSREFQTGQVWRMGEDRLQIQLVGKLLVHYRHFRGVAKRPPSTFSAKGDLDKFLSANKAILLRNSSEKYLSSPARGRTSRTPDPASAGRTLPPAVD